MTQVELARYGYDARTNTYRDRSTGKFVRADTVRKTIDSFLDRETNKARLMSQDLIDGNMTIAAWQTQMAALLKNVHVAVGMAACGGIKNITPHQTGSIGHILRGHYGYLRDFAEQIANGKQPLNGSLLGRTALYVQAARGTYEMMVRDQAVQSGRFTQERNILGMADHCAGCLEASARGWQPIGTLAPIGERDCLQNCRCRLTFR